MSLYALLGHGRVLENLPLGSNDSVFSCVSMRPIALKLLQKHSDRAGITQITQVFSHIPTEPSLIDPLDLFRKVSRNCRSSFEGYV